MPTLYNCKHSGDQYRITKFDSDWNVESSYLCDLRACECPAGARPKCRHREMLPKFIQRNHIGDEWFWDHDRGGWVQGSPLDEPAPMAQPLRLEPKQEPSTLDIIAEQSTIAAKEGNDRFFEAVGLGQSSDSEPSQDILSDLPANHSARSGDVVGRMTFPSPTIRRRV